MAKDALAAAFALLQRECGLAISAATQVRLQAHLDLVRAWNRQLHLVSSRDQALLEECHLVDALSLVPILLRCERFPIRVLDIGSGGGFPMIPVHCVLPDLEVVYVERSVKKAGFLERAIATVGLERATVMADVFPDCAEGLVADVVTARAVERPERVLPAILRWMPANAMFLCQTQPVLGTHRETFHVEHVEDRWQQKGLRRGMLHIITRKKTA